MFLTYHALNDLFLLDKGKGPDNVKILPSLPSSTIAFALERRDLDPALTPPFQTQQDTRAPSPPPPSPHKISIQNHVVRT
jgi:hypothetical protein